MRLKVKPQHLLKSLKPLHSAATISRHLSAEPHLSSPSPSLDPSSPISQTLSILQTTDSNDWPTNPKLSNLLSSLSPPSFLKISRQLPSYQSAINFLNHLTATSLQSDSLSFAFQAVLEHALHENPEFPAKLRELFMLSKDQNIHLSINAATLLMKRFGQARMLEELIMVFDAIDPELKNTHVINLVIDGYMKCGRVDDALKLLEEMLERDSSHPPNSNTVGIVFSSILKENWKGRSVEDVEICKLVSNFGEHGVFPSSFWLTKFIMKLCRNRKCGKAWEMLHVLMNMGCDVGSVSCNALLTGLRNAGDYEKMNLLLKEMKEKGIRPDVVTIGILINHLCRSRRVDEALDVFEKMTEEELGIEPDVVTFNSLINGFCKVGRQEEGLNLMERMRLENKCEPNAITYNCLIDGFCKVGKLERARELLEQMDEDGVKPNVITFNTLLDGMCKHGRVSSAMELFSFMSEKGLKGNAITYTTLITAFCNANNIDRAMKLFDEMQENGCSPDAIVYYSLISGLSLAGRMDDASFIVSKMKKAGFCLDIVSYNILIGGFCRKKKLDKAHEIIKDMEQAGLKPDRVTYNTLFSFFCASGDFKHARTVMKKMTNDGITPTVVTYGALIQAYCSNNDLVAAMKIFRDMSSSSKVSPNAVIYNILIDSHCKNNDVEAALFLMNDMNNKTVKPNTTTYNAMFKGLQQRNWFEKALELMDQMTEQACKPDYVTMEILTEWFSAVGEMEKLRNFVDGYKVFASIA